MEIEKRARIAALNDQLRRYGKGGRILVTRGALERGALFMKTFVREMRAFDRFNTDNDPYEERDFGAMTVEGERVFWKIDYYDRTMDCGAEDPSDPATVRVLTMGLASEY
jgi:hypothetical protein